MFTDLLASTESAHGLNTILILGIAISFISAALAVKWLVGYLTRHGLSIFAWYRFFLAALVIFFLVR